MAKRKLYPLNNAGKPNGIGHTGPGLMIRSPGKGTEESAPFPVSNPDSGGTSNSKFGTKVASKPKHVKRTKGY